MKNMNFKMKENLIYIANLYSTGNFNVLIKMTKLFGLILKQIIALKH